MSSWEVKPTGRAVIRITAERHELNTPYPDTCTVRVYCGRVEPLVTACIVVEVKIRNSNPEHVWAGVYANGEDIAETLGTTEAADVGLPAEAASKWPEIRAKIISEARRLYG